MMESCMLEKPIVRYDLAWIDRQKTLCLDEIKCMRGGMGRTS